MRDLIPAITAAPDQVGTLRRPELPAVPVGLEAVHHLVNFVLVRGDHRIIAGFGEVLGLPIERVDEGRRAVYHHRFFMRQVEGRVAVDHLDAGRGQLFPRPLVLRLAAAARRVQHQPHLDAPPVRARHRFHQRGVRKHEHLDPQRFLRPVDGFEDGLGRLIGQDNQRTRHVASLAAISSSPARARTAFGRARRKPRPATTTARECRSRPPCRLSAR